MSHSRIAQVISPVISHAALAAAIAMVGLSASPQPASGQIIFNLGTLGGNTSSASGINSSGQVTGISPPSGIINHAFRSTGIPGAGGTMDDLGTLGNTATGKMSIGTSINALGQVAGWTDVAGFAHPHAFLYTGTGGAGGAGGTMLDLGTNGADTSVAYGVNSSAQITGYFGSATLGQPHHAFLYTGTPGAGGAMLDLNTLGGSNSQGNDINDHGQVAGTADTDPAHPATFHAFIYSGVPGQDGAMADLGTLGGTESWGNAINNSGQVTGRSITTSSGAHAFRYSGTPGAGGMMSDLGTLGTTLHDAEGLAIDSFGNVVGQSEADTGAQHAFLYTGVPGAGGAMIDLDTWLDSTDPVAGAQWVLSSATGINDSGFICGYGSFNDGVGGLNGTRAFVLDVRALVPEPTSAAMLILGAMPFLRRRRVHCRSTPQTDRA